MSPQLTIITAYTVTHDIKAAWNHDCAVSMLTFDITGFFNTIPHSHLLDILCKSHIPLPIVKWTKSFLLGHKAAICLDGKQEELKEVRTGIPQGSCMSLILAVYFTALLEDAIRDGVATMTQHH